MMDAAEAERCGLVSRVVAPEQLMNEALAAAQRIASSSRMAVLMAREAVERSAEMPLQEGLRFERRLFEVLFATADQKEGAAAFLEKRPPRFRNG
jgi:enoyl-CoA hydratase